MTAALHDIAEAMERVADLRERRQIELSYRGGQPLDSPHCERRCLICRRACAVTTIKLEWWERELVSLTGSSSGRVH
ncbi:MAG TPA: hypothetical protein VHL34_24970 [Rhizomicrobium sp.]|jgi:formate hydrogenlyase subunit 6/NADH:ubiquinone oxidoreductase subunit I|nr:hypothetical protein [Rhizomicrobium sp.]